MTTGMGGKDSLLAFYFKGWTPDLKELFLWIIGSLLLYFSLIPVLSSRLRPKSDKSLSQWTSWFQIRASPLATMAIQKCMQWKQLYIFLVSGQKGYKYEYYLSPWMSRNYYVCVCPLLNLFLIVDLEHHLCRWLGMSKSEKLCQSSHLWWLSMKQYERNVIGHPTSQKQNFFDRASLRLCHTSPSLKLLVILNKMCVCIYE